MSNTEVCLRFAVINCTQTSFQHTKGSVPMAIMFTLQG
ncbi:hypothetical protein LEMLEM_LOCUS3860 [Lemmus lemmus]